MAVPGPCTSRGRSTWARLNPRRFDTHHLSIHMTRRRSRKPEGDGLLSLISFLPWWACLLVGVVGWWVCWTYAATSVIPAGTLPRAPVMSALWHGLASTGQYALPILCGAAALASWI